MAQGPDDDPENATLRARLGKLSSSLDAHDDNRKIPRSQGGDTGFGNAMGLAFRGVTELIAGVVVGGGVGYLLDKWLHTKPIFLALCLVLGLAGGFWNIVRTTLLTPRGPGD